MREIIAVDYHRNGVGGEGFYVALFTDTDMPGRKFLAVSFDEPSQFAALDVDQAAAGNIFMHRRVTDGGEPVPGTGGNAWRGDNVSGDLYDRIRAEKDAVHEQQMASLRRRREQMEAADAHKREVTGRG